MKDQFSVVELFFRELNARRYARPKPRTGQRDGSSGFKLVTLEDEDEKRAERPLTLLPTQRWCPTAFGRPPSAGCLRRNVRGLKYRHPL